MSTFSRLIHVRKAVQDAFQEIPLIRPESPAMACKLMEAEMQLRLAIGNIQHCEMLAIEELKREASA